MTAANEESLIAGGLESFFESFDSDSPQEGAASALFSISLLCRFILTGDTDCLVSIPRHSGEALAGYAEERSGISVEQLKGLIQLHFRLMSDDFAVSRTLQQRDEIDEDVFVRSQFEIGGFGAQQRMLAERKPDLSFDF